MKEYFAQTITNIVAGAVSEGRELYAVGKAGIANIVDLIQTQAPELVREIVVYHRALYSIYFLAGVLFIIGFCWGFRKLAGHNDEALIIPYTIFGGTLTVFVTVGTASIASDMIKVWFAPRLFLIEYISGFINKV